MKMFEGRDLQFARDLADQLLASVDVVQKAGLHDTAQKMILAAGYIIGLTERAEKIDELAAPQPEDGPGWVDWDGSDPSGPEATHRADIYIRVDTRQKSGRLRENQDPAAVQWADVADPILRWKFTEWSALAGGVSAPVEAG